MSDQSTSANSRRDLIKKAAVVGGVAWAAPMISSSRAFAQGSLSTNLCKTGCSVPSVTYRFNGGSPTNFALCAPSTGGNAARGAGDTYGPFTPGTAPTVTWTAWKFTSNLNNNCGTNFGAPIGASLAGTGSVLPGQSFTINTSAGGANIKVLLEWTESGVAKKSFICYHLSCSQPLCFNDTHGPFTLMSYTVSC